MRGGSNEAESRPKNRGLFVGISDYLFAGFLGFTGEARTNTGRRRGSPESTIKFAAGA
jgi:hypothetical protein